MVSGFVVDGGANRSKRGKKGRRGIPAAEIELKKKYSAEKPSVEVRRADRRPGKAWSEAFARVSFGKAIVGSITINVGHSW